MFDLSYVLLVVIPGIVLGAWAQSRVRSAYARASQIPSRAGLSGADVARVILDGAGIRDVVVEPTEGYLSDHYHPILKRLRLSSENYDGTSLAAAGVAAHEVGHALQHARGYLPLFLRSALVPACQAGQWIGQIAMLVGAALMMANPVAGQALLFWAILGYGAVFLFTLVTLPVEFNASSRALEALARTGLMGRDELPEAKRVLDAAALTYVASAVQVFLVLAHLLSLFTRPGGDGAEEAA